MKRERKAKKNYENRPRKIYRKRKLKRENERKLAQERKEKLWTAGDKIERKAKKRKKEGRGIAIYRERKF